MFRAETQRLETMLKAGTEGGGGRDRSSVDQEEFADPAATKDVLLRNLADKNNLAESCSKKSLSSGCATQAAVKHWRGSSAGQC